MGFFHDWQDPLEYFFHVFGRSSGLSVAIFFPRLLFREDTNQGVEKRISTAIPNAKPNRLTRFRFPFLFKAYNRNKSDSLVNMPER